MTVSSDSGELVRAAGLARRAAARFIDALCMLALCVLASFVVTLASLPFAIAGAFPMFGEGSDAFVVLVVVSMILLPVGLVYCYEVVSTARRGQTLGKRLMGVCVIRCPDPGSDAVEPPRRDASVKRWALPHGAAAASAVLSVVALFALDEAEWTDREFFLLLSGLGAFVVVAWAVCYVSALWEKERRGWHDRVAGTVVVGATDEVLDQIAAGCEHPGRP